MKDNISTKMEGYLNENVHKYMNQTGMSLHGTWATETEIMATAILIEYEIVVYS